MILNVLCLECHFNKKETVLSSLRYVHVGLKQKQATRELHFMTKYGKHPSGQVILRLDAVSVDHSNNCGHDAM
jgi:hypothetical protein